MDLPSTINLSSKMVFFKCCEYYLVPLKVSVAQVITVSMVLSIDIFISIPVITEYTSPIFILLFYTTSFNYNVKIISITHDLFLV